MDIGDDTSEGMAWPQESTTGQRHSTSSNEVSGFGVGSAAWVPLWSLTFEKVQRGRVSSLSRRDYDSVARKVMMLDDSGDGDYADYKDRRLRGSLPTALDYEGVTTKLTDRCHYSCDRQGGRAASLLN